MNDTVQFALFFKENTVYSPVNISSKIIEKIPEIGLPILLPINTDAPKEANVPFIIFNQNNGLQIISNFNNIVLTVKGDYLNQLEKLIISIYDIFSKESISFSRIGYVPTFFLDEKHISEFRNSYMNNENFNEVTDFQFSWLKVFELNNVKINCWERNITDSINHQKLIKSYDFNTNINDIINVDKKFIKEFISFCDEYIDDKE